ncbi:UDP-4-amino-4,6-dideoxy-N-acetyl-beta-L-altrosamine N-acetyltransferase [Alteromonas sp. K632G]|jgi:UDP-4-amino-4,6-dideoxy-N-acetyl-beta-L-altrosamine N-acetyltransferase|uniref:UDP-4-amino-4, 6-dideoxy-N-acetyl-beta-L-altrosamine N-acetyltransferase n=1 Tax=Alteromonas sp. K632G TaxID=2820757 RepID=UPI000C4265FB|nr:UDP-4-amino-4,6-dideoxy-N-acetyl-beta-L-altrosamine N-acetyltransferase [Alteromonas sp. K632G]MBB66196.1 UDP-4-amino-4,6-dideoxy-N-acetyl-beta-L-altrosamine N-acetyltransferase [Rickettsiales bacterium]MBO7920758.1 UDP-4-amino-4,6-dideoxy-N-acetyl-beta-L-altrosamine N-acetyltransferase [Alteromonas sp. K632G]
MTHIPVVANAKTTSTKAKMSPNSQFIPLNDTHLETVLRWRNLPHIRANMHSTNEISWQQHLSWFETLKNDSKKQFFVFLQNERPVGVLNFTLVDAIENPHELTTPCLEWGCYIGEDNVWPGSGLLLEIAALDYAFIGKNAATLYAEVLSFNQSVLKMHKLFQYDALEDRTDEKTDGTIVTVKRFLYHQKQWLLKREKVLSMLPKQIGAAAQYIHFAKP